MEPPRGACWGRSVALFGIGLGGCASTNVGNTWQCPLLQGSVCARVAEADPGGAKARFDGHAPATAGTASGTVHRPHAAIPQRDGGTNTRRADLRRGRANPNRHVGEAAVRRTGSGAVLAARMMNPMGGATPTQ